MTASGTTPHASPASHDSPASTASPVNGREPTILATSGGHRAGGGRTMVTFNSLVHHAVELSGAHGRRPRVLYVGTAIGDAEHFTARMTEAARVAGFDLTPLNLFPMPNLDDVEGTVLDQDVVWVMGGSVANLLAVWRVHGLDDILRRAWRSGVVLSGVSAGSICWFRGGTTDSFGPELRPVTDALGFLPYGTASTTTPTPAAAPWSTNSSRTARSPPPTAPTTEWAWSTAAPNWSRRSPKSRARARTS
ncbi:peptidase E [Streptomyces umbrinus]|uniref:Peptidase E n=1 Tax=Streptomyces umbrinus TaxID=67370 RepID=A0ABU0T161_9ACTN|nr:peptidase E [Streptomyces umbrinus]